MINRIFIGTPLYSANVSHMYLRGALDTAKHFGDKVEWSVALGTYLVINRQVLLDRFLKSECTHMLYVDSDIGWMASDIEKLLELEVECVGGAYLKRNGENVIVAELMSQVLDSDVKQCFMVGAGFLMLQRKLIEDMAKIFAPVWSMEYDIRGYSGEDVSFCNKVNQMSIPVWVHTGVMLNHSGDVTFTINDKSKFLGGHNG